MEAVSPFNARDDVDKSKESSAVFERGSLWSLRPERPGSAKDNDVTEFV